MQASGGRAGVLADERYGQPVAEAAHSDGWCRPFQWNAAAGTGSSCLETADAARAVVTQVQAAGRDDVRAIVLGRDAPAAELEHWLAVAGPVDGFAGFAIGRSIWEDPIISHNNEHATEDDTISRICERYLNFARQYCAASGAGRSGPG